MSDILKTTTRLTGDKADFAYRLKDPDSNEAEAARQLTGRTGLDGAANTTLVNALIDAGIDAIRARAVEVGYERLAEFHRTDPEHRAWRASRRHRRPSSGEAVA